MQKKVIPLLVLACPGWENDFFASFDGNIVFGNNEFTPDTNLHVNCKQMKITVLSIPVRDQGKALKFYTEKLGFLKKQDVPLGEGNRWLTLVSKEDQKGPEILLEPAPLHFKPSKVYQDALMEAGIPYTQFGVENVQEEYDRLSKLGVEFSMKPTEMGNVKVAVFNDTCGNNIQLVEEL